MSKLTNNQKRTLEYKCLSLYDAETQKHSCLRVKKSNFNSPEELDAYCTELRNQQKKKNAEFKRSKAREKIVATINRTLEDPRPLLDNIESPLAANIEYKPNPSVDIPNTGVSMCIFGASKRGKSTLMMYLYDRYFATKDRINTLFSGNPQLKMYKNDKRLIIGYGFGDRSAKYVKLQQYINVKTKNRYQFTDLFDDIIDQKHAPVVNKLILTYRNSNISCIICLQYVYLLSKSNRSSVNHCFIFGANTYEDAKSLIDAFLKPYFRELGMVSFDDQVTFFREVTRDHGFIHLDNLNNTIEFCRLRI